MRKRVISFALAALMTFGVFCFTAVSSSAAHVNAGEMALRPTTSSQSITVDGIVEDEWQKADEKDAIISLGGSKTTAKVKTLWSEVGWSGVETNTCLYILVEVDKHDVAITGDEIVYVGINLTPQKNDWISSDAGVYDAYGVGILGVKVDTTRKYSYIGSPDDLENQADVVGRINSGWLSYYGYSSWCAASKKTSDTTFVAEFAFDCDAANAGYTDYRMWETSVGAHDGFGVGTTLGLNVLVADDGESRQCKSGATLAGTDFYGFKTSYEHLVVTDKQRDSNVLTAYNADIIVDGKIDDIWALADSRALNIKTGETTATGSVKLLYGNVGTYESNKAVYGLIEIDTHGTAINDNDTVKAGFQMISQGNATRNGEVFGTVTITASADGTIAAGGWLGRYCDDSWAGSVAKLSDSKWIVEFEFDLSGANTTDRPYKHGEEDGCDIGTTFIGTVLYTEGENAFYPEEGWNGLSWNADKAEYFEYPGNTIVLGEAKYYEASITSGIDSRFKQATPADLTFGILNRNNEDISLIKVDDVTVDSANYTFENDVLALKAEYLDTLCGTEKHVLTIVFPISSTLQCIFYTDEVVENKTVRVPKNSKNITFNPLLKASAWDNAPEYEAEYVIGDCNATVTFKPLWYLLTAKDGTHTAYLYILTTVCKNGEAVTDDDTVMIGIDAIPNYSPNNGWNGDIRSEYKFCVGHDIITADGESSRDGWRSIYTQVAGSSKHIVKKVSTDTFQVMSCIEIPQVDQWNEDSRNWLRTNANGDVINGFGIGSLIGIDVLYAENKNVENAVIWSASAYDLSTKTKYNGRFLLCDENGLLEGENPAEPDVLYGDVNGDGKIKGNDATLLLKHLAEWDVDINEANADVNGDGKIKGNDATLLLKYLAEWNVTLGPSK